jgi:nucleoside-diphosphate kinase
VEPIPAGQSAKDYLEQNVNKTLIKALTALCKEKPQDAVVSFSFLIKQILVFISLKLWLADKLMEINPYKPKLSQVEEPPSLEDTQASTFENTR